MLARDISAMTQLFAEALSLHERLRFDPDGLDATQVIRLTDLCDQWRAKHLD